MTRRRSRFAAVVAACAVGGLTSTACGGPATRVEPPRQGLVEQATRTAGTPGAPLRRTSVLALARRFAAAYAAWDAGRRGPHQLRALAASATAGLVATLQAGTARPVAYPPQPLSLTPLGAYRAGRSRYRVPLGRGGSAGRQVVTLVVAATPDGPRVVALQR